MTGADEGVTILPRGCVCGHDHLTSRGEHVEMCLDCQCSESLDRCQNCGREAWPGVIFVSTHDRALISCSRPCALQLEHAVALKARMA